MDPRSHNIMVRLSPGEYESFKAVRAKLTDKSDSAAMRHALVIAATALGLPLPVELPPPARIASQSRREASTPSEGPSSEPPARPSCEDLEPDPSQDPGESYRLEGTEPEPPEASEPEVVWDPFPADDVSPYRL
jgi:hypothetical protein